MTDLMKPLALFAALGLSAMAFTGCDVDVDEGEMPEVEVKGGEAPDVDVEGPKVEYETKEVQVPVGIDAPEEGSTDPKVD